jgi:antitoxin CptB
MRELDVLLGRYLDERWPLAEEAERAAFESLLEWPDPEIVDLCLRRAAKPSAAFEQLLGHLTGSSELSSRAEVNPAEDARPASRGEPQT